MIATYKILAKFFRARDVMLAEQTFELRNPERIVSGFGRYAPKLIGAGTL